jgi:hypothetical protein
MGEAGHPHAEAVGMVDDAGANPRLAIGAAPGACQRDEVFAA